MKKTVLIFAMVALLVFSAIGATAENYYPTQDTAENYSYTVACDLSAIADDASAIVNGQSMYGLVAVVGTGADAEITSATSYVYLDQATVDGGVVTFAGFLPMGVNPDDESFEECTLFIGGPGFNTAKEIGVLKKVRTGVSVTGTVVDTVAPAKTATITIVIGDENVTAEAEADGTFEVIVPVGENYSVKVSKTAYLTFTYTGVNATDNVDLGEIDISNCAGDVDGNSFIEFADLQEVLGLYNQESEETADIDGNGYVEFPDLQAILGAYNKGNADRTSAFVAQ